MTLLEIFFIPKYIAVCTVKDFLLTFSSSILPEDEGKADAVRFVGGQRSERRGRQDDRTGQAKQGRQAGRLTSTPSIFAHEAVCIWISKVSFLLFTCVQDVIVGVCPSISFLRSKPTNSMKGTK